MTSVEIYLELLRAGLWNRPAVVSGAAKLSEVLGMAVHQTTQALVSQALLDNFGEKLPEKRKDALLNTIKVCENSAHAANTVIAYVFMSLGKRDITPVLLKGQGIGSWYPVPTLRLAGDIDLYVREYVEATEVLEKLFGANEGESDKHVSFHVGGNLELELHQFTETISNKKLNAYYQRISNEGTSNNLSVVNLDGSEVYTPEDTFNAFYIFHHLWHHTEGMGIGMRQLCDWTMFLHTHSGKLDLERLGRWLKDMHLMDVWQVFGCAAVQALDLPKEDVPFYDSSKEKRGRRLLAFMLEQGDNREFKHGRGDQSALKHKGGSFRYIHKRFAMMFPIFPGKALLQYVGGIKNGVLKLLKARTPDLGGE